MHIDILHGLEDCLKTVAETHGSLHRIKPEYLATIKIYSKLQHPGRDIYLEESTYSIATIMVLPRIGGERWKRSTDHKILKNKAAGFRHGRVDIFINENETRAFLIEVKGVNPAVGKICEDIERIIDFFRLNGNNNTYNTGYIAFSTHAKEYMKSFQYMIDEQLPDTLTSIVHEKEISILFDSETGEGTTAKVHCLEIRRNANKTGNE